jgi:hypothetical protein
LGSFGQVFNPEKRVSASFFSRERDLQGLLADKRLSGLLVWPANLGCQQHMKIKSDSMRLAA